jgi:FMN phosphatase YigB (HAD superfamily)
VRILSLLVRAHGLVKNFEVFLMNPAIQAFVFDAYSALFDPHSIRTFAEAPFPGHGAAPSQLWRAKQLEYTWLRTLMHRIRRFLVGNKGCAYLFLPFSPTSLH